MIGGGGGKKLETIVKEALTIEWNKLVSNPRKITLHRRKRKESGNNSGNLTTIHLGKEQVTRDSQTFCMLTVSYLLKLTIFGGENNDNIYSSEVVKKTKKTVLIHIASRRRIRQLFTVNKECGVSFKNYFGDADEDFY